MKGVTLNPSVIAGWAITLVGTAVWLYGYFVEGHPPLINWQAHAPWWVADYLHNIECEIGMMLTVGGSALTYWPA